MIPEGKLLYFLCRFALHLFALLLLVGTVMPLFRSDEWWIRVFDFPRMQIAALIILALAGYALLSVFGPLRAWEYALPVGIGLGLLWQLFSIAPYTSLYPRQMSDSRAGDNSNRVSLLIYNVLAENREVEALRILIRENDPDVILLSEPTQWWLDELESLKADYPYSLLQPQENKYGMMLFSRLVLVDPEVRFLIEPEIPSLRTKVRLRSGTEVTLYGLHPRPPGIHRPEEEADSDGKQGDDSEREDSDKRDAELLLVAKEINKLTDAPVIVAGDFNDVAWSRTTHLFQRIGGLLDPRIGRGLFNTFDTRNILLRYPLDHIFATQHFLLVEMRRLPNIGSDHFPMLVVLDFDPSAAAANEAPQPEEGDKQQAAEAIQEGKTTD